MFSKKKKSDRVSWEYLKKRYPDIIEELKSLRNWDRVKSSIPEAESMSDYSIVALHAISALIRELRIERELLGERIEIINSKIESTKTESENNYKSLKKELEILKEKIEEIERRTIFLENVEKFIPKINELEERLQRYQIEIANRVEEMYLDQIMKRINELVEKKIKDIEKDITRDILGISTDLAKTLKELQEKYEVAIKENIRLSELMKEKDSKIKELTYKLSKLQETSKKIEELTRRVEEYERSMNDLSEVKKELIELTGVYDINKAIKILKEEFVPKSKIEHIAKEVKNLMDTIDKLKKENEKLMDENKKLKEVVKALLSKQEGESEE
ncbi:coiled-coil domain-containing protein [Thermococcus sp.]